MNPYADVYRVKGQYYVTARGFTTRGAPVSAEPYLRIPAEACDGESGEMVLEAVHRFGKTRPHPKSWSDFSKPLLKFLGVRSWRAIVRENAQCTVEHREDGSYLVEPLRSYDGKGFEMVEGKSRVIPDADPEEVWRAVKWALDTDFD